MAAPSRYTIYPIDAVYPGTSQMGSSLNTPPASTTTGTGWNMSKTAINNYAPLTYGTENATFTTTVEPQGATLNVSECIVAGPFEGQFVAGSWNFQMSLQAVTIADGQAGRVRFRMWVGSNPVGTGAQLISATTFETNIVAFATTGTPQITAVTASGLPIVRLDDQYLFFELAWQITNAAGKNNADADIDVGTTTWIDSPSFEYHASIAMPFIQDEYPAP